MSNTVMEEDKKILSLELDDVLAFENNVVWKAIMLDMQERLATLTSMLMEAPKEDIWGNPGSSSHSVDTLLVAGVNRLQGACVEVRTILGIVDYFKSVIENTKKEGK